MRAAQGLAWREPSAKSQTAPRSCLLTAQRKVTALCLPDWRVEGAAPARQISAWGSGKRARQSPISASRRAARTVPELGSDLGFQRLDLGVHGGQRGGQGAGDMGAGGARLAGGAARCRAQPLIQLG